MKNRIRHLAAALMIPLLLMPVNAAQETDISAMVAETAAGLRALGGNPGALLAQGSEFPAGTSVCDWTAMALALAGSEENYQAYSEALTDYVECAYAQADCLDPVKSTEYHRIALLVLSLGGDPTAFGTKPDGSSIDLIADGTYAFAGESVGMQGLNGWIYALLTLDASGAAVPQDAKFTREDMLHAIVTAQEPDGGFGLAAGKSDVDITAMALQALAPYAEAYAGTVEAALAYLSDSMDESCRYSAYGSESAESAAQVILALCALGIDPEEDSRFCRNGRNVLTGLEAFRQEDGTYGHTLGEEKGNYLATAQTLLALKALESLRSGRGWIFDFTGYEGPVQKTPYGAVCVTGAGAAVVCILIAGKRKKYVKNNG